MNQRILLQAHEMKGSIWYIGERAAAADGTGGGARSAAADQGRGGVPGSFAARLLRGRADAVAGADRPAPGAAADARLFRVDARIRVRAVREPADRPGGLRAAGRPRDPAGASHRRGQVHGQLPALLRRRAQDQDQVRVHGGADQDPGRHHGHLPVPERPRPQPESRLHLRRVPRSSGGRDGPAQAHPRQGDALGSRDRGGLGGPGAGRSDRRGHHGDGEPSPSFSQN